MIAVPAICQTSGPLSDINFQTEPRLVFVFTSHKIIHLINTPCRCNVMFHISAVMAVEFVRLKDKCSKHKNRGGCCNHTLHYKFGGRTATDQKSIAEMMAAGGPLFLSVERPESAPDRPRSEALVAA